MRACKVDSSHNVDVGGEVLEDAVLSDKLISNSMNIAVVYVIRYQLWEWVYHITAMIY